MNNGTGFEGFMNNGPAGNMYAWGADGHENQGASGATFEPPAQATSVEKIEPANTENVAETMMAESAEKVEFAPSTVTTETMEKTAIEGVPEPAIVPGEGIKSESEDLVVPEEISAVPVTETVQNEAHNEPVAAPVAPPFEEEFARMMPDSVGNEKVSATTEEIKADVDMSKEAGRPVSEHNGEGGDEKVEKNEERRKLEIEERFRNMDGISESGFAAVNAVLDLEEKSRDKGNQNQLFEGELAA